MSEPPFDPLFDAPLADREPHPASLPEDELLRDCKMGRGRSGGPGGQHRNKVETATAFTHLPTGVTGQASERRSPEVNRSVALRRLRLNLATERRMPVPPGDARSELWRSRVRKGRIACSTSHTDFPSMIAEAMDMIWSCAGDPKKAATRLSCTASQLIKLVKEHPPAFEAWNRMRKDRGDHALK